MLSCEIVIDVQWLKPNHRHSPTQYPLQFSFRVKTLVLRTGTKQIKSHRRCCQCSRQARYYRETPPLCYHHNRINKKAIKWCRDKKWIAKFSKVTGTHAAINVPSKESPIVASSEGGCGLAAGVVSWLLFGDIGKRKQNRSEGRGQCRWGTALFFVLQFVLIDLVRFLFDSDLFQVFQFDS